MSRSVGSIIGILVFIILLCCCFSVIALAALTVFQNQTREVLSLNPIEQESTEIPTIPSNVWIMPEETPIPPIPEVADDTGTSLLDMTNEDAPTTLEILSSVEVPKRDPIDLAYRLKGISGVNDVIAQPTIPSGVGYTGSFWVIDSDTEKNFMIQATLQAITDHAYIWLEDGISFDRVELTNMAKTFEEKIYPVTRDFFGNEWSPGVDQDERIYIVFAKDIGSQVAGYYSSADEIPPEVQKYSNGHEMFILNSLYLQIGSQDTLGVLAHEFQHMIHWNEDKNEATWLNEGFSELATYINGYYQDKFDYIYLNQPDIQLNDWPNDQFSTTPHYGSSFLFTLYFLDQYGEEPTKTLATHPLNGFCSVDSVIQEFNIIDSTSGNLMTTEDLFSNWVIANYLNNPNLENGQYGYKRYPELFTASATEVIDTCPTDWQQRDVNQFGVDYILVQCDGNYTLELQGVDTVNLLPENPYDGDYAFWSNKGDESDMRLTHTFDFTSVSDNITLSYWTWYDIEVGYDYAYLLVSEDGNQWDIIQTPLSTIENPTGNNYGWGYNGVSGSWIEEKIDLSSYAGKQVDIRFEYVTDAAVNGEGFLIDQVSIPAIGYETSFEEDDGGWVAEGFIRISNPLPQVFAVSLVSLTTQPQIEKVDIKSANINQIPVQISNDGDLLVVISGTTRYTRQLAYYRYRLVETQ